MSEPTNRDRARWAEVAIEAFIEETNADEEDAVSDLLADLLHLCEQQPDRYGSFYQALSRGESNYTAERDELVADRLLADDPER